MSTFDSIEALEEVNAQLIDFESARNSEFALAKKIIRFKEGFPLEIPSLIKKYVKDKVADKKYRTRKLAKERYYPSTTPRKDRFGVVYTCITGGYDNPIDPVLLSEELDYVLFTDEISRSKSNVWNAKAIDRIEVTYGNNVTNRYYKMHPYELFPDLDYSIYIDGNVQIVSDITGWFTIANESRAGIAMHEHAWRDCAYVEAEILQYFNRGDKEAMSSQIERYRSEGFPERFGLLEATIIVVDLKNTLGRFIMNEWWNEFIASGSGRDQVSLPYILWKNGLSISDIGCLGNDKNYNPKFRMIKHVGKPF